MSKNYDVKVCWHHKNDAEPMETIVKTTASTTAIALKLARREIFAQHLGACIDKAEIVYDEAPITPEDAHTALTGQKLPRAINEKQPRSAGKRKALVESLDRNQPLPHGSMARIKAEANSTLAEVADSLTGEQAAQLINIAHPIAADDPVNSMTDDQLVEALGHDDDGNAITDPLALECHGLDMDGNPLPSPETESQESVTETAAQAEALKAEGITVVGPYPSPEPKTRPTKSAKTFVPPPVLPRSGPIAGKKMLPVLPHVAAFLAEIKERYGEELEQALKRVLTQPNSSAATQATLAAIAKQFASAAVVAQKARYTDSRDIEDCHSDADPGL